MDCCAEEGGPAAIVCGGDSLADCVSGMAWMVDTPVVVWDVRPVMAVRA